MGVVGELVQVECEAVSAPPPSGVIWTFMGRTIDTGESKSKCPIIMFKHILQGKGAIYRGSKLIIHGLHVWQ